MSRDYKLLDSAQQDLAELYRYGSETFGARQADTYLDSLFSAFGTLCAAPEIWRAVPASWDVPGYFYRHEAHHIFFRETASGDLRIFAVIDSRRDLPRRLRESLAGGE